MKKFVGISLVLFMACSPAFARDKKDAVAKLVDVNGPKAEVQIAGTDKWLPAPKNTPGWVTDKFQTDTETAGVLEFVLGGRVGLRKGTVVEILDDGEVDAQGKKGVKTILLKSGGLWAKFNKQQKPLNIQTNGGVMGIKGTEFVVDTSENGESSVVLVEGSVDYKANGADKPTEVKPGEKLSQVKQDDQLYTVKGPPKSVDKTTQEVKENKLAANQIPARQQALDKEPVNRDETKKYVEDELNDWFRGAAWIYNLMGGVGIIDTHLIPYAGSAYWTSSFISDMMDDPEEAVKRQLEIEARNRIPISIPSFP